MRPYILMFVAILVLMAACETNIPDPVVIVEITAVDDTTALAIGVADALTSTAMNPIGLTETELARLGYTLTPTPSQTPIPSPAVVTATPLPGASPTFTPSVTPTPTYAPLPTNVALSPNITEENQPAGRLRIANAWIGETAPVDARVDVYVNDARIARALDVRQVTAYQQVAAGAVRVDLHSATAADDRPLVGLTVPIPAGGSVSLVVVDLGSGLVLIPVLEDVTPLPTGMSRLTVFQANPLLLESNLVFPQIQRELIRNLQTGQIIGPFDLPSDNYRLEFYDSFTPDALVGELPDVNLTGQVNHLMVLVPASSDTLTVTDQIVFTSSTRLVDTDVNARFINAANQVGTVSVAWDGRVQLPNLQVGNISVPIPISSLGITLNVTNSNGNEVAAAPFGPWPPTDGDKIVVMLNGTGIQESSVTNIAVFSQNPSPSPIRANLRLINALPDTVPLSLQTSLVASSAAAQGGEPTPMPWEVVVANVSYGQPSNYSGRAPNLYEVRVVLTGTDTAIAAVGQFQLLAGGTYDFIVVPGSEPGSAELLVVQPDVQPGSASVQDPEVLQEIVAATLTAMVTPNANTPTPIRTPTTTITPVPTNTVHPTNTPSILPSELIIDPAPPNTAVGTFTVLGINFVPEARYTVNLDGGPIIRNGTVNPDGTLLVAIPLPANISPGPHIVGICVDCRVGGTPQAVYGVVIVAGPNITPSPTRQA
jgi:hypothetical protein